jgi:predicted aminopeptidase
LIESFIEWRTKGSFSLSCPFLLYMKVIVVMRFIIVVLFLFVLTSCTNTFYVGKLAWGEAKILSGAVTNQDILRDERVGGKIKEGIRLVQEVKEFSRLRLGLRSDASFETFYRVKGDTLMYLVTTCPKDRLVPYTWRFPIVGKVAYKGFFERADAFKEIKKLENKGMDTCMQQAIAFSTLGWLSDPLYSTVLNSDLVVTINIVIHELVHTTVFFKGETEFNEQVASYIAEKGTIMFIEQRFGRASPFYQHALDLASDERLIAGFFQELYDVLKDLYDKENLSRREKLRMREEIFANGQRRLAELSKRLRAGDFAVPLEGLNNAVVLAYRRYQTLSDDLLQQAYEACDNDVKGLIELLLTARESKQSPYRFLERWLEGRSAHPSGLSGPSPACPSRVQSHV